MFRKISIILLILIISTVSFSCKKGSVISGLELEVSFSEEKLSDNLVTDIQYTWTTSDEFVKMDQDFNGVGDVCDDFDATKILLEMDPKAKQAGITALTGMGSSPGVANLLAKFCAEHMLYEVYSIDILHAHGGETIEGAAVVAHRIHSMLADIPMYLDGKFTKNFALYCRI